MYNFLIISLLLVVNLFSRMTVANKDLCFVKIVKDNSQVKFVREGNCMDHDVSKILSEIKNSQSYEKVAPENCNVVCDYVMNGTLSNEPIGMAFQGSVAKIFPPFLDGEGINVYCDCPSGSENAWTVFQRRMDGRVDFYRYWDEYARGFGNISGEFWLGLDWIYRLTANGTYKLRVDLEDWDGNRAYAEYSSFVIGNPSSSYVLTVDGFSGNAGDALRVATGFPNIITNMHPFSTRDRGTSNCASRWEGAWWFNDCFGAHLNGRYYNEGEPTLHAHGIIWYNWKGYSYSLKAAEMKFRRK